MRMKYLGDAVLVGHHSDHVLQRQQGRTLDLRVDVLPLSAGCQELHQRDVIPAETGICERLHTTLDVCACNM